MVWEHVREAWFKDEYRRKSEWVIGKTVEQLRSIAAILDHHFTVFFSFVIHPEAQSLNVPLTEELLRENLHVGHWILLQFHVWVNHACAAQKLRDLKLTFLLIQKGGGYDWVQSDRSRKLLSIVEVLGHQ